MFSGAYQKADLKQRLEEQFVIFRHKDFVVFRDIIGAEIGAPVSTATNVDFILLL